MSTSARRCCDRSSRTSDASSRIDRDSREISVASSSASLAKRVRDSSDSDRMTSVAPLMFSAMRPPSPTSRLPASSARPARSSARSPSRSDSRSASPAMRRRARSPASSNRRSMSDTLWLTFWVSAFEIFAGAARLLGHGGGRGRSRCAASWRSSRCGCSASARHCRGPAPGPSRWPRCAGRAPRRGSRSRLPAR